MTSIATNVPSALDLSHHINTRSRSRHPSPLKDILQFMAYEGMISLSGGLPHPSLFPIRQLSFTALNSSGKSGELIEIELSDKKEDQDPLAKFLQYGNCKGNDTLRNWCLDFTANILRPAYNDFEVLLHPGNTNAWSKVVALLCEEGEHILCEAVTYPSAQALWIPEGYFAAPVAMDGQGIRDDALEDVLSTWEETHPGKRRPHVLYLVSVGSNPSGVTMGAERRKKIYDLAVKYGKYLRALDFIIVEDDPYFFIQFPDYEINAKTVAAMVSNEEFVTSLAPSFLHFDFQGRVIRLDSFSKTLAPGMRLGYFVANPIFIERLLRATEVETQDPSGPSQAIVLSLLEKWTMGGYLEWLQNLRLQYMRRRDCMIDAFSQHFQLVPAAKSGIPDAFGIVAFLLHSDGQGTTPIFSFVPPSGGMFIWVNFYLSKNPRFKQLQADSSIADPEDKFSGELWRQWIDAKVLLVPGWYYHPWQGEDKKSTKARAATPETSNFRFSYSMPSEEEIQQGVERFASVVKHSWEL
ncbi:unnamed protein product [Clonostachys chloroleuca]|uniref:Aminotransferase class I/classII large domain-containing protein n=1 Tax=Clonostachys chloroleuca TaxID=1926264 RepID=A0AA35LTS3_9HYPO|nr:unnamed protein product [Clonostachys chloroleuca]